MARKLDQRQQGSLSAFVDELARLAGYETTAEWSRESGYPASNLSKLRNGNGAIDGFNLLRLIEAAAARSGSSSVQIATAAVSSPRPLSNSVPLESVAGRLEEVEAGLAALAAEVRRALEHRDALESRPDPSRRHRGGSPQ